MSFQRTASGLSNMYLFSGVDAIVFVEGGMSRSEQEVYAGAFESESQDIAFWQKWFDNVMPTLRVQLRAVGSKLTLYTIALKIADGSVTHVYVAMDRDFDNILGRIITSPKVLYTFGYSWENDVWNEAVAEEVFFTLCGLCRNTTQKAVKDIIVKSFAALDVDLHWATKADFLCFMHTLRWSVRQSPQRIITPGTRGAAPAIDRAALLQCVREAKAKRTGRVIAGMKVKLDSRVDCCGHVIATFAYNLLGRVHTRACSH